MLEPTQQARTCQGILDHLERDRASGLVLFGFVDRAHAAFAQQADNPVLAGVRRNRRYARPAQQRQPVATARAFVCSSPPGFLSVSKCSRF